MLETKVLEVRDAGTFIPVIATKMLTMDPVEAYYVHGRCGYSNDQTHLSVILARLDNGEGNSDPYDWPGSTRTMRAAHLYIEKEFYNLASGDVVDVEYIMGITATKKLSERVTHP